MCKSNHFVVHLKVTQHLNQLYTGGKNVKYLKINK